jgi:recombinational DNA repair protein (RecF pathway)
MSQKAVIEIVELNDPNLSSGIVFRHILKVTGCKRDIMCCQRCGLRTEGTNVRVSREQLTSRNQVILQPKGFLYLTSH